MAKTEKVESKPARTLDELQNNLDKRFGDGTVFMGRGRRLDIATFSTGVATLDMALGNGLPIGRIVEIYGMESSGKTTTCLQCIKACQQHQFADKGRKGVAAFIDAEHALDTNWAEKMGVDVDSLILSQPECGEDALVIAEEMARSGLVDLIVIDSVSALIPRKMLEGDIEESHIGLQARLMSTSMRRLSGIVSRAKTTIIFINQIRQKIGVMFGNPETTSGGLALKFFASVRLEIRKAAQAKVDDSAYGNEVKVKVVKNKCAPPFAEAVFTICFGNLGFPHGVDEVGSILDLAVDKKTVERNGSWFSYGEMRLGNGLAAAKKFLLENPEMVAAIKEKTYRAALGDVKLVSPASLDAEDLLQEITDE